MAVNIQRTGAKITLIISFMTEEGAAETYDRLNEELEQGSASLTIDAVTTNLN